MRKLIKKLLKEGLLEQPNNLIYGHNYNNLLNSITSKEANAGDEPKELLDYKIKELKKIEKEGSIILYRVLFIKNINDINKEELGNHYVDDSSSFHEGMMDYLYGNAKQNNPELKETDVVFITVKTPTSNIDYYETLRTFSEHPWENEVTIKDSKLIEIKEIIPYYN